jgi:PAS domain S-box-containing protein
MIEWGFFMDFACATDPTQKALRRGEAYLAEAQRLTRTGSWAYDPRAGETTYWSEELFRIFGLDPERGLPTNEEFWDRIHPDDRDSVNEAIREAQLGKAECVLDYRILLPDGTLKYIHSVTHPVVGGSGEIVELVGTAIDVTERKHAEEARHRSEQLMRDLFENVPVIACVMLPDGSHPYLTKQWTDYSGLSGQENVREAVATVVHPEDADSLLKIILTSISGGKPFEYEARFRGVADGEYRWFLCRGTPQLDDTGATAKLYGVVIDIEDRKRAEEAGKRSEAYLSQAQRLTKTGSWVYDPRAGETTYWSEELYRIFGLDPQRGLPTSETFWERIHPDDRDALKGGIREALGGNAECALDFRIVLPDGTLKYIHSVTHPVVGGPGEIVELVGTAVDVTERTQAEEALRRSEAYLAEAQRLTHTGCWARGPAGIYWSEENYRIWGFDPHQPPPDLRTLKRRIHDEDRELLEKTRREQTDFDEEFRIVLPDGNIRHIHAVGHRVLDVGGELIETVGTAMDVTERKLAEEAVRASERELRDVIETIPVMAYVKRPDGTTEFVNRRWYEYTGVDTDQTGLNRQSSSETCIWLHPDDVDGHARKWQEAQAAGAPLENEVRHRGKDGRYRWFLVRNAPLHDEHGNIVKWFCTLTDIDERKRAEENLKHENVALREEIDRTSMFEDVVGNAPTLRKVLAAVSKVAAADSTVLISGETGTGKELIARAIHRKSARNARAFVPVNCAAIPQSLISSELFGHEKGAFTGALQRRLGRFELAEGGTIFLDEVGELPIETQIALLRVLQEKEFQRVGGSQTIRMNVRVLAATNRDLERAVAAGEFRKDLFYRLNVFPIHIPSLSERSQDIPLLVDYFIERFARSAGKKIRGIEKAALDHMKSYAWPGNIRELQNVIERAVIICESETLTIDPSWLSVKAERSDGASVTLEGRIAEQERDLIAKALTESDGRVSGPSGAAAKLGIPASTLEYKIHLLKINKHQFKKAHL